MDLDRYRELVQTLILWKRLLAENIRQQIENNDVLLLEIKALYEADGSDEDFTPWLDRWTRQAAIQWILRLLFLRVLEDRHLLGANRIRSKDGQTLWAELAPRLGVANFIQWCCRDAARLLPDLFAHTDYDAVLPSDDLIQRFIDEVWRREDPDRQGWLRFDFRPDPQQAIEAGEEHTTQTDPGFRTRFIGDLYQELDAEIRERYALLQTPDFVAEFILENTLGKRFAEQDFRTVTLIDPTCGSGHFLVDAFWMFVTKWEELAQKKVKRGPENSKERVKIARWIIENNLFGCDINPYATALTRFRLLLAACEYAQAASLREMAGMKFNIVTIDSLIPYEKYENIYQKGISISDGSTARVLGNPSDVIKAMPVLKRRYDVVVGNPPYILAQDANKRELYREHYKSAYSKFGLSAPFTERFIVLAQHSGYIGLINSNAFARRQFGQKLIEDVLPKYALRAVIDLSGAYIPGHGTPTVILFIKHESPTNEDVLVLSNLRGEPGTPSNPSMGKVWQSVVKGYKNGDGFLDDNVDVALRKRNLLSKHPWQFGGDKTRLFEKMRRNASLIVGDIADSIGPASFTGQDEIFVQPLDFIRRIGVSKSNVREWISGETIRDWNVLSFDYVLFPYSGNFQVQNLDQLPNLAQFLSRYKKILENIIGFGGQSKVEEGFPWYAFYRLIPERVKDEFSIAYAEIVSHNHFILDKNHRLFNRTAPVISSKKFDERNSLSLLGILNSSSFCFCLKQMCFNKGTGNDPVRDRYVYAGNYINLIPVPQGWEISSGNYKILQNLVNQLNEAISQHPSLSFKQLFTCENEAYFNWNNLIEGFGSAQADLTSAFYDVQSLRNSIENSVSLKDRIRAKIIFLQEEMDWVTYELYGLIKRAPLAQDYLTPVQYAEARLELGHRAFEQCGRGYTGDWPDSYSPSPLPDYLQKLTSDRIALMQSNTDISILEDPLYKRRWVPPDYDAEFREVARWWLAEKLEYALEQAGRPLNLREWAGLLRGDERVNAVLEVLTGTPAFNLETELLGVILENAVPNRREHYLKPSGLRKMNGGAVSLEDLIAGDFSDKTAWRIRGKLNIPRERFIHYKEFDAGRGSVLPANTGPWFGWAGWNAEQRAIALAELLEQATRAGWQTNYQQCGLRAALRDLLSDLPEADRMEFEAIAGLCGISLEARCYCQSFQEAFAKGEICAPGVTAETLGVKVLEIESKKGWKKKDGPEQLSLL